MKAAAMMLDSAARTFDWEEVPCLLCHGDDSITVLEGIDHETVGHPLTFRVVCCKQCGLWYTNPRPTQASIGKFYPSAYGPHRQPKSTRLSMTRRKRWQSVIAGRPCREHASIPIHGRGRLLDFGCGGGNFLIGMKEQGWRVTALDVSAKVIQHLKQHHGIDGHVGTLPHAALAPESFDVITMWASLEHVHHPLEALRAGYQALAPGGRLYVEVHNVDCWDRQLFGQHWFSLDLPRHLVHFNAMTLRNMLTTAGFQMREERTISHPSVTRKSLEIASRSRSVVPYQKLLALKPIRSLRSMFAYWMGAADHLLAVAERPAVSARRAA